MTGEPRDKYRCTSEIIPTNRPTYHESDELIIVCKTPLLVKYLRWNQAVCCIQKSVHFPLSFVFVTQRFIIIKDKQLLYLEHSHPTQHPLRLRYFTQGRSNVTLFTSEHLVKSQAQCVSVDDGVLSMTFEIISFLKILLLAFLLQKSFYNQL